MSQKEKLIKLYEDASYSLLDKLRASEDALDQRRKMEALNNMGIIISALSGDSVSLVLGIIEKAYKAGSKEALEEMVTQGAKNLEASFKSKIHKEAVQNIVDDAFYTVLEATDYMSQDVKNRLETIIKAANSNSLVEGLSRKAATKKAVEEATKTGITGIVTKNGSQVPVDKYLAGTISYYQRKAHVDGSINRMMENGQDLIYVNSVGITCSMCAQYQGRVYSISGKDSRFPKLELRPPYHGHCVHSAYPWNEDYESPEDVRQMLKDSNRPFKDNRTEENIKKYKSNQKKMSKKNVTRKQWMQYKSRMPYIPDLKTFASHKSRRTKQYREWLTDYKTLGKTIGPVPKIRPVKVPQVPKVSKPIINTPVKVVEPKIIPLDDFMKAKISEQNKKNIKGLENTLDSSFIDADRKAEARALLNKYKAGDYNNIFTTTGYKDNDLVALEFEHNVKSKVFFRIEDGVADDIASLARESFNQAEKYSEIIDGAPVVITKGLVSQYNPGTKMITMSHLQKHRLVTSEDGSGFLNTFLHEIGHREHYDKMDAKEWNKFKKVSGIYYKAQPQKLDDIGLKDSKIGWEFVVNAKHWEKNGKKDDYFQEMFAESTSVYLSGTLPEKVIMQKAFPGIYDFLDYYYKPKLKGSKDINLLPVEPKIDPATLEAKRLKAIKAKARRDAKKAKKLTQEIDLKRYKYISSSHDVVLDSNRTIRQLDDKEREAITVYTGGSYSDINGYLREGPSRNTDPFLIKVSETIKEVIEKKAPELTENIIVTRRVGRAATDYMFDKETASLVDEAIVLNARRTSGVTKEMMDELNKRLINGKVGDKGFLSSSHGKKVFMKSGVELQMHLPKGYRKGLFVESISDFQEEKEFLLYPDQKFKILEITMSNDSSSNSRIILKVVPDN